MELKAWQLEIQEKAGSRVLCYESLHTADSVAWDIGQLRVETPVPHGSSSSVVQGE